MLHVKSVLRSQNELSTFSANMLRWIRWTAHSLLVGLEMSCFRFWFIRHCQFLRIRTLWTSINRDWCCRKRSWCGRRGIPAFHCNDWGTPLQKPFGIAAFRWGIERGTFPVRPSIVVTTITRLEPVITAPRKFKTVIEVTCFLFHEHVKVFDSF